MTTSRQVLACAKKAGFVDALKERGFDHLYSMTFHRLHGERIHQLLSGGVSYGENLTFSVTCFVEELMPERMESFPQNVPLTTGGNLGDEYFSGTCWEVSDTANIFGIFPEILDTFDRYALPWFNSISTRAAYLNELFPHVKRKFLSEDVEKRVLAK